MKNCIVIYTQLDDEEITCANNLITAIKDTDFSGHIIYQKGGWPNLEEGDLILAHQPYSYKISAIREALRLGYEKVMWINCNLIPESSINALFTRIVNNCVFAYKIPHSLLNLCYRDEYKKAFQFSRRKANQRFGIYKGVLGFDLQDSTCLTSITSWYNATLTSEMCSLMGLSEFALPSKIMSDTYDSSIFPDKNYHFDTSLPQDLEFSIQ